MRMGLSALEALSLAFSSSLHPSSLFLLCAFSILVIVSSDQRYRTQPVTDEQHRDCANSQSDEEIPVHHFRLDHSGNVSWVEFVPINASVLPSAEALLQHHPNGSLISTHPNQPPVACESWWDGIYQWPPAPTNSTISIECHVIFELTAGYVDQQSEDSEEPQQPKYYAHRKCLLSGRWGWNNWTNYTECLNLLAQQEKDTSTSNQVQEIISIIVLILLIASLVSLIISIVIFMTFKPLNCLRIRVHKNLCVALLINCCLYILMNSLVGIHRLDLSVVANWFCKMLKCFNVYSSMATINWMFVEGFLFHRRLISPFRKNTRFYLITYYTIGWVLPAGCVLAWCLSLEFFSVVKDKPCWEGYRSSNTIFIVSTPMILAVAINFMFLISIIRILVIKLRADKSKSDQATIKAIKATALLIPLLGIHHLIVMYNPSTFNRKLVNVYIIINVLFQSVQGIIVSVLYCFTNNEVRCVLNSAWSRRRLSHSFLGNASCASLHAQNSLLSKQTSRRPNSFNSLIVPASPNLNQNNNHIVIHHPETPTPSYFTKGNFLAVQQAEVYMNGTVVGSENGHERPLLARTVSSPAAAQGMTRNSKSFPSVHFTVGGGGGRERESHNSNTDL